ncbi:hypothetical protein FHR80_002114 [Cellulomonas cellasea]|uniref:Uncharacterized protein n=1 Tax=Cellulomonas cellasea TaxID=43670 RepID=A0A7W4UFF0_9CELL|nr:hypothetical protein [Cellulomonas cellasea]
MSSEGLDSLTVDSSAVRDIAPRHLLGLPTRVWHSSDEEGQPGVDAWWTRARLAVAMLHTLAGRDELSVDELEGWVEFSLGHDGADDWEAALG